MNFGGIEQEYRQYETSGIVILPIPYDGTSTWVKGADKGPDAILEASENMELYDIETNSEVYKKGIFTDEPVSEKTSPEKLAEVVEKKVDRYIKDNKFVVCLGGEHSVSIGVIKSFAKNFENITILQIDAHSDMREEYLGSAYNHACVMARAKDIAEVVQVGIRSMDVEELKNIVNERVFYAHDIVKDKNWIEKVVSKLTDKVYLTIDLDGFDPSIMPSTGTPEPGGLLWYDVINLLTEVIRRKKLLGFDVVELCPNENNKAPNFLASKLIYRILSEKFFGKSN